MDRTDIALIQVLQKEEIFLTKSPFEEAANLLGWSVEEVLERTKALVESGVIRRFGAALTPRNAGFKSNSMIVWDIEDGRAEEVGTAFAEHQRVSHCYIRPRFEGFPYNVYTMVHGNSPDDLQRIILNLSEIAQAPPHRALHSIREFKKSSPVYYPGALEPAGRQP